MYSEGLIYGGKFAFQNRLGSGKEIYHFCFVCKFQVKAPWGAYIRRGDLAKGFLRYDFEGLIFGGAYTWRGLLSEFYGILEYAKNTASKNRRYVSRFTSEYRGRMERLIF